MYHQFGLQPPPDERVITMKASKFVFDARERETDKHDGVDGGQSDGVFSVASTDSAIHFGCAGVGLMSVLTMMAQSLFPFSIRRCSDALISGISRVWTRCEESA